MLGKKIICSFFPARHKKFPSQEDKIGWFPSQLQLQSEQPASRKTTIFYIVRQNGRGKRPEIYPSVGGGGGERLGDSTFLFKVSPPNLLVNIIYSKTNPSAVTNFPASSSEHLLFCQPARFLWGTDKVRNRFVGCP